MNIDAPLAEATTLTQPDLFSSAIKTFSALALILAVILIGFYLVKRFWPRGSGLLNYRPVDTCDYDLPYCSQKDD